jgi:excisionase family DNA binding protein
MGTSVDDRAEELGISRATLYREIRAGRLMARKVGERTVIIDRDWQIYLESLPSKLSPRPASLVRAAENRPSCKAARRGRRS